MCRIANPEIRSVDNIFAKNDTEILIVHVPARDVERHEFQ